MSDQGVIKYLTGQFWCGRKPTLARISFLLNEMGNPHEKLKFIHVAGTNGKGSTSAFIATVLQDAGYKTGLFSSPYLHQFAERFRINNVCIPKTQLNEIAKQVLHICDGMEDHPTEFEMITAIAFKYFFEENCDIVVLEVGMGGRLDPTNVIQNALVSVITNIGLDHTKELGDNTEKIAYEKGGIIKQNGCVVLYRQQASVEHVIEMLCAQRCATLVKAGTADVQLKDKSLGGQMFDAFDMSNIEISLLGSHQLGNAAVAIKALMQADARGLRVPLEAIRSGMQRTRWPGRFELVRRNPDVIIDGGHNLQCAQTVSDNLALYFPNKRIIILVGFIKGKDHAGMIRELNKVADGYVAIEPVHPKALPAHELGEMIKGFGKEVTVCKSIGQGVKAAIDMAGSNDVVCSFGSLYMTGEIRASFGLDASIC